MKLDDIFEIGEAAHKAVMKSPNGGLAKADRARTIAIVRALRDELDQVDNYQSWNKINEIISDDEVSGGPNRKAGDTAGQHEAATSAAVTTTPATPSPDLSHRPGCPSLVVYECTCGFHTNPTDAAPAEAP